MKISDFKREKSSKKTISQVASQGEAIKETIQSASNTSIQSFRIKDALEQMTKQQPKKPVVLKELEVQEQINKQEDFDQEKVTEGLQKYLQRYQTDTTIALALNTHIPLVEKEKITIWVDNQLQLEKLEGLKSQLSGFMMKYLNNGKLVFNFQLFDTGKTTEKKRLYTAAEKYDHFIQLNPVIAELKQLFGLELE